jgi:hypothetical protein
MTAREILDLLPVDVRWLLIAWGGRTPARRDGRHVSRRLVRPLPLVGVVSFLAGIHWYLATGLVLYAVAETGSRWLALLFAVGGLVGLGVSMRREGRR